MAEVNAAVNQMDEVTQQNAAMVEQASAAAENLRAEAANLSELIARFRLGAGAAEVAAGRGRLASKARGGPSHPVHEAQSRVVAFAQGGGRAVNTQWEEF